jgi:hypothetical protein
LLLQQKKKAIQLAAISWIKRSRAKATSIRHQVASCLENIGNDTRTFDSIVTVGHQVKELFKIQKLQYQLPHQHFGPEKVQSYSDQKNRTFLHNEACWHCTVWLSTGSRDL